MKNGFAKLALAAMVMATASACGVSGTDPDLGNRTVALSTDKAQYAPGNTVQVSLQNVSATSLSFNFCPYQIQRASGAAWTTVATVPIDGAACPAATTIESGTVVNTNVPLPGSLTSGTYRVFFPNAGASTLTETQRSTPGFQVRVP